MRRSAPYDPRSVRRFNQRASSLQVNASKYKQKRLHFLVFPWWNLAFSMGYGRKNKKIPLDPNLRIRLWARRLKFDLSCLSLTARGAAVEFFKWERYSTDSVFRKELIPPFLGSEDAAISAIPSRGRPVYRAHAAWIAGQPDHNAAMFRASRTVLGHATRLIQLHYRVYHARFGSIRPPNGSQPQEGQNPLRGNFRPQAALVLSRKRSHQSEGARSTKIRGYSVLGGES
jgi:hypothetical protein